MFITMRFADVRILCICIARGPVLGPLKRDLRFRICRTWPQFAFRPFLRRWLSFPLPLLPDVPSPRASLVSTFHTCSFKSLATWPTAPQSLAMLGSMGFISVERFQNFTGPNKLLSLVRGPFHHLSRDASCEPMLAITTTSERASHWTKMRRSLAPFIGRES